MKRIITAIGLILLAVGIFMHHYTALDMDMLMAAETDSEPPPREEISPLLEPHLQKPDESAEYEGLIRLGDFVFQLEDRPFDRNQPILAEYQLDRLRDFDFLRTQFFIANNNTGLLPGDIDTDAFLAYDFRVARAAAGPQVLIFHTHSTEMFADSNPANPMDGVLGLGALLQETLENRHGIPALHDTTRFDIVDGRSRILGAYERMEEPIRRILRENPSIEIVIDLHRDGIPAASPPLVTEIDGRRVARIMFVNGLSRRLTSYGELEPVAWLPNPYLRYNLAFTMQLQIAANNRYPGFTRRPFLNAFRYSLHLAPRTMLVEIGAQNNTMEEARNAIPYLAAVIADVVG